MHTPAPRTIGLRTTEVTYPGGTFTVRAAINPDHYARIEVQDNGGPWNQAMIDPTRHHGLDIVRAVADEWGIDDDHISRTIWARFDCPE
jgi:hypothetical protein